LVLVIGARCRNARTPARMALWLDGRWWLGVVGGAGVGWRESTTFLVIVYALTDAGLASAASCRLEKVPDAAARVHWQ